MTATAIAFKNRTAEDIADDLLTAKKMEEQAKALRIEIEEELIAALGDPGEASKTHRLNGYKVEFKGNVNRKVDWEAFDAVVKTLEHDEPFFVAPIKIKRELDETQFKRLYREQPGVYARLAKGVTATPGKTTVSVSRTE